MAERHARELRAAARCSISTSLWVNAAISAIAPTGYKGDQNHPDARTVIDFEASAYNQRTSEASAYNQRTSYIDLSGFGLQPAYPRIDYRASAYNQRTLVSIINVQMVVMVETVWIIKSV